MIPDAAFAALYQAAWQAVQKGDDLLALRDQLDAIKVQVREYASTSISPPNRRHLDAVGWVG